MTSVAAIRIPKLPRRHNPKVKTGCRTCKKRRIKCDEERPACFKCTSTGRVCDGYVTEKNHSIQIFSSIQGRPLKLSSHIPTLYESSDNVHHLEFYHYCVGPTLSGRFDTAFWSRIVFQLAHSERCVRNALITLSHLNETIGRNRTQNHQNAVTSDRTFWLCYNKSVRYLVERMNEPSYTPEVGLVTCILFICIEFLQDNSQTAFTHISNGLRIISELRKSIPVSQAQSLQASGKYPMRTIEETIVPIFTQGLMSALMYGVSISSETDFLDSHPQGSQTQRFTSVNDALSSYGNLRNASILLSQDIANNLRQAMLPSVADLERRDHIMERHCTWLESLLVFEQSRSLSTEETVNISALKVAHYSLYIACACAADIRQMTFDAHLDSFKALLHHARIVIKAIKINDGTHSRKSQSSPAANFTFDTTLIPALSYTAMRCRCPTTRREAVALLHLDLPREGLCDAEQHSIIAERVIEIEEAEVDRRGWPTERARVWCRIIGVNVTGYGRFQAELMSLSDHRMGLKRIWTESFTLSQSIHSTPLVA